jgi:hypothetical protein
MSIQFTSRYCRTTSLTGSMVHYIPHSYELVCVMVHNSREDRMFAPVARSLFKQELVLLVEFGDGEGQKKLVPGIALL